MAIDVEDRSAPSERYMELVRAFPLRPIRSEAELVRAIGVVDGLTDRASRTPEEDDYRDVLAGLVHQYESTHEPEPDGEDSPADMLRFLIESRGVTRAGLASDAGISEARISQILDDGRRPEREEMIALGAYFAVHPSIFL